MREDEGKCLSLKLAVELRMTRLILDILLKCQFTLFSVSLIKQTVD